MRRRIIVFVAAAAIVPWALTCVYADTVTFTGSLQSGTTWDYYYVYNPSGSISAGWYWEITDIEGVIQAAGPAGSWQVSFAHNWVRWTYTGSGTSGAQGIFDITATAPPAPNRPWSSSTGASGTTTGPLPEPSTVGLLLLGFGVLGLGLKRKVSK